MPAHDHAPAPGWYDDPERALRLRWWDGVRWTTHTRAKAIVELAPVPAAAAGPSSSGALAAPGAAQSYAHSAPHSWSPATPSNTAPSAAEPDGWPEPATFSTSTRDPHELWNSSRQSIDYSPVRTTTPAAWALAFTPLVTALAETAVIVLSGFESTPIIWILGAIIIPVLWIIMWVRRDRITLHEWGHLRRAHWGWAFFGALGYLAARTIVVRRQATGRGWWPLVTNLSIIAVLVNVGLFTPVVDLLRAAIL